MSADEHNGGGGLAVRIGRGDCPSAHSLANKLGRAAWGAVWLLLFRPSPGFLRGWRRFLLRCFGARVGRGVKVMPSVRIWAPWMLRMVLGQGDLMARRPSVAPVSSCRGGGE